MPLPRPVKTEPIEEGLDRLNITHLRRRFLQINAERMLRTRNALNHRQEVFLDALPLLFHCNHPMLPGYVSHATPCGISEYKPGKRDLISGKSLARSFCLTGGHRSDNIWSMFLMGSLGTLAHTSKSDFDVWLCHRPDLTEQMLDELQEKCRRISRWAAQLRLEVHFFLMNCETFKAGKTLSLDAESSGSAQRALLLDEFYRTALHIAGRLPLWWFTPANQEHQYTSYATALLDKRFVRPNTTLDFGGLSQIPAGEYLGAGVWQLYKAIASPYKSVLKLLTMEAYVAEYDSRWPLAMEFKQRVYEGELNVDDLDPYLMVYRRIESYLNACNEPERLEFARRCFYFKIGRPLSKPARRNGVSWQRQVLQALVAEWGWSAEHIARLDRRPFWKASLVLEERNLLVRSLNASYETLLRFAQLKATERAISDHELHILGRKLNAAFERRPDKIELINPGISRDISEPLLRWVENIKLSDRGAERLWELFDRDDNSKALRQGSNPVELLLWCYMNQVIDGHIQFDLTQAPSAHEPQLRRCLACFQQWLPLPRPAPVHDHFAKPAAPARAMLILNFGRGPTTSLRGLGVQRLSGRNDPLCYGSFADNLIYGVDMISENSWQEVTCRHFEGRYALVSALADYLSLCLPGSGQTPPTLAIHCFGLDHAAAITQRVEKWFADVLACYFGGRKPPTTRYLFALGSETLSLQFKGAKLEVQAHADPEAVMRYLSEPQRKYSPVMIDDHVLGLKMLKLIAKRASATALHVFYQRLDPLMRLYLVDEKGSIIQCTAEWSQQLHSLRALNLFLHSVLKRIADNPAQSWYSEFGVYPVEFHEIKEDTHKRLRLTPSGIGAQGIRTQAIELKAVVVASREHTLEYSFHCLGQWFEWAQLGQDVFYAVAQFVLRQREDPSPYRIHITDLDLQAAATLISPNHPLQASHYLRVKQDVEHKLMMAARVF